MVSLAVLSPWVRSLTVFVLFSLRRNGEHSETVDEVAPIDTEVIVQVDHSDRRYKWHVTNTPPNWRAKMAHEISLKSISTLHISKNRHKKCHFSETIIAKYKVCTKTKCE